MAHVRYKKVMAEGAVAPRRVLRLCMERDCVYSKGKKTYHLPDFLF